MTTLDPGHSTGQVPATAREPGAERDWLEQDEGLPVRRRRQHLGLLSLLLCGALVAAGAFFGGVLVEKHSVKSTTGTASLAAAFAAARGGTTATTGAGGRTATTGGAGAGAGGFGGGGGATVGSVTLIDGPNIYVTTTSGEVVKVATGPQSTFSITSTGTLRSVKPGDTVAVTGPANSEGTVTATAVRDLGAGAAAGTGRGGGAGAGGAASRGGGTGAPGG